jgi:endoglucanase
MASLTVAVAMLMTTGAAASTTVAAASVPNAAATAASACPAKPASPSTPAARAAVQRQVRVTARAHHRAATAHARAQRLHRRAVAARAQGHVARARADARHARLAAHHARRLRKAAGRATAKLRKMRRALKAKARPGVGSCVYVHGGQLVDGNNDPIHPVGVTHAGSEYACIQGWGMFDGPTDDASIAAMAAWNVQIVRIPLNEDCWLGINLPLDDTANTGTAYQNAIESYVHRLESHGMIVDLDLHWTAPAEVRAGQQAVMADADHSAKFWSEVATAYRNDHHVVFELFNEPHDISWNCWENGCTIPAAGTAPAWQAAGMQQLVTAVRSAHASNVVILGGLGFSGDISQWKSHQPSDPLGQEAAAWHIYNFGSCTDVTCWSAQAQSVTGIPVVVTEIGETDNCASGFVNPLMSWLDKTGYSYLAWTWNDWGGCGGPTVISSYDGTPNGEYGAAIRAHFLSRPVLPN